MIQSQINKLLAEYVSRVNEYSKIIYKDTQGDWYIQIDDHEEFKFDIYGSMYGAIAREFCEEYFLINTTPAHGIYLSWQAEWRGHLSHGDTRRIAVSNCLEHIQEKLTERT